MLHERSAKDPTNVSESTSPGTLPKACVRNDAQTRKERGSDYPAGGISCS